jgi:regulation of enolase protein 1 (concanavalin A-like superfamily)
MFRNSLDANAVHATMFASYSKGLAFQRRGTVGGTSVSTAGALVTAPVWIRARRVGTSVTAESSADGVTWMTVGTETLPLNETLYVGIAVTSHADGVVATQTLDNVSVTSYAAGGV